MALRNRKRPLRRLPDWLGEKYQAKVATTQTSECHNDNETELQGGSSRASRSAKSECISALSRHNTNCDMGTPCVKKDEIQEPITSRIISSSMAFLHFKGSVIYSFNSADCSLLCDDILASLPQRAAGKMLVGFDLEWPVTFKKGHCESKTALVQMCVSTDKCYLFHLSPMGNLPSALKTVISHDSIVKYGLNIEADFWKLERDYDIRVRDVIRNSVTDLGKLANVKLKSAEKWSLDGLTRNILHKRLDKNSDTRCGDWNNFPLSEEQKQYAANDAYACFLLAMHLMQ